MHTKWFGPFKYRFNLFAEDREYSKKWEGIRIEGRQVVILEREAESEIENMAINGIKELSLASKPLTDNIV